MFLFVSANTNAKDKTFVFVVTSRNNSDVYKKNLDSIFSQKYENYKVIYIDDCSTDSTADLVESYVKKSGMANKVTIIRNRGRTGALHNICFAVHGFTNDLDIVILLDGDDWLANSSVLDTINREYLDPNILSTYGFRCEFVNNKERFRKEITKYKKGDDLRKAPFYWHSPRTFYSYVFKSIKIEDFLFKGKFPDIAWDRAIWAYLSDLVGIDRLKFIDKVMYVYNIDGSDHDFNKTSLCSLAGAIKKHFENSKPYKLIIKKQHD